MELHRSTTLPALLLALLIPACGHGGGRSAATPPADGNVLTLQILQPAADLILSRGGIVQIVFSGRDPRATAEVSFVADQDGDPTTAGDQYFLISAQSNADGNSQELTFDLPTSVPPGTYAILGTIRNGSQEPANAQAPGRLIFDEAPTLEFSAPAGDVVAAPGATIQIGFAARGVFATAAITLAADADGDLATIGDQHVLATATADSSGASQTLDVNLPSGMPLGTYAIVGTATDGQHPAVMATAAGRLLVDVAPILQILEPSRDIAISRGGALQIEFTAHDPGGAALVGLVADADGDPATLTDQYLLAAGTSNLTGGSQTVAVDLTGIPIGTYQILGTATDGSHPAVIAVAPGWLSLLNVAFAEQEGGAGFDEGRAIASFPDASLVVTGRFGGTALFGTWPNLTSLNSAGDDDIFIARYRPDGSLQWARRAGSSSSGDWGNAVATFADGSCVVSGYFHGLATFGSGSNAVQLASRGDTDVFLARYQPDGSLAWARAAGGLLRDVATGIATFADGSCVVTGSFLANATFGDGGATLVAAGSPESADVFVARYNADGSFAWAKRGGGAAGHDISRSIAAFPDGSCVVAGSFSGTATFGAAPHQTSLISAGGYDVFVARYEPDGSFGWATRAGGFVDDEGRGIAALPDGSCVATGSFGGAATFGGSAGLATLGATGALDVFVARYLADGSLAWAKRAGGGSNDEGSCMASLPDGRCLVTGLFQSLATFGESSGQRNLASSGWRDVFVACYHIDGSLAWVRQAGGANDEHGSRIAGFADGSLAITGSFLFNASFGAGTNAVTLNAFGFGDVFVVRYNADGDF